MAISSGSNFPSGVDFAYIPIDLSTIKNEDALGCSKPLPLKLDKLIEQNAGSNILFVSVPGAFTPTCTENHVPPYLDHLEQLKKEKNISAVVVLSANDPFVLNAWGKLLLKNAKFDVGADLPKVLFASDPNAQFSKDNEISLDLTGNGMGVRTGRYAFVVNADTRSVNYYGVESGSGVEASGYEAIKAAKL
ncbi:Redoxin [Metschnikowia bicuspidata var. bicuspidata NRRL YB-4993]|uniref:Redoxin n=1 Tax=Metschnikowia bicuspidata var. bicuspidata NRRL YB-4993 TaxID=869754 RepID=A0A1A0H834_9ASCO|nr:Redoxin [Metschnikowia bicuspidata var. bicuspidata NRRL YB-4993]OBA20264.1 Redoxin [Metschnikowia bicuspidata var. bicuspidata NRRL YB-4993]